MSWLMLLKQHNSTLIIDEAFINTTPEFSMSQTLSDDGKANNLIILRSVGKFFGLAGLRLGFVLANDEICHQLALHLGPWGVNHPACWIGAKALIDTEWQKETIISLKKESLRLYEYLLTELDLDMTQLKSTHLFVSVMFDPHIATEFHNCLAK